MRRRRYKKRILRNRYRGEEKKEEYAEKDIKEEEEVNVRMMGPTGT